MQITCLITSKRHLKFAPRDDGNSRIACEMATIADALHDLKISTPGKDGPDSSKPHEISSAKDSSSDGGAPTIPESDPDLGPCLYASKPVTSSERVAADGNLTKRSKRTDRLKKRQEKLAGKKASQKNKALGFFDLPAELLFNIIAFLRPSSVLVLMRACQSLRRFILEEESFLAREIIARRYPALEKCFRLPALLSTIEDESARAALLCPERLFSIRKYHTWTHIPSPDPDFICSCLTCLLRWNSLAVALDFAYWQPNLNDGEPIPMIARGTHPRWNTDLTERHDSILRGALASPLWYARLLELHLASMAGSIRRQGQNKGNRRRRYLMTPADEADGTDAFLERNGPPTVDFPVHRDNYYMLEAYLPNRGWNAEEKRWMYMPDWHWRDLELLVERARAEAEATARETALTVSSSAG